MSRSAWMRGSDKGQKPEGTSEQALLAEMGIGCSRSGLVGQCFNLP